MNNNFIPNDNITNNNQNNESQNIETQNNISQTNMSGDNNPYKDFLPENRFKRENNGVSPKVLKGGLVAFYGLAAVVIAIVGLRLYGYDVLKVESREYNMNLSETINLDNMYMSPNVEWKSNSDNVIIENNVITAVKTGEAYIIAVENNKVVKDLKVSVLTENEKLAIDKHDLQLSLGSKKKIKVNTNDSSSDEFDEEEDEGEYDSDEFDDDSDGEEEDEFDGEEDDDEDSADDGEEDGFDDGEEDEGEYDSDGEEEDYEDEYDSDTGEEDDFDDDDSSSDDSSDYLDNDDEEEDNSPSNENSSKITYQSSNEKIAKVDNEGNIEPVSPGTVVITVTDNEGNKDHAYVTIKSDILNLYSKEYSLKMGETIKVEHELISSTHTTNDLKWESENKDIIEVDSTGKITTKGLGTTNIKVSVGEISETIKVTVNSNITLPTSLSLSKESVTLTVGNSTMISATINPSNATNKDITWTTSNMDVANVINGQIVGKSIGTATISATTVNGIRKSITVKVIQKVILDEDINFNTSEINLKVGSTKKLEYKITPDATTDKTVSFNYDKNYIELDKNGLIKALKAGTTYITATTKNNHSTTLKINITNPNADISSIKINEGNISLTQGVTKNLTTTILPDKGNNTVKWTSSNSNVVSVSSTGQIKSIAVGEATITASISNVSNSITVKVVSSTVKLTNIAINKKTISLKSGKTEQLSVKYTPDSATNKSITWTSSNNKVATVDSNGKVTAISKGTATITAKANDGSNASDTSTVTVSYSVSMKLNDTSKIINVGDTFNLKASISPAGASQNVTWSSDKTNIATVDKDGKVKGVKEGTAYITATSVEDKTISIKCKVEVKKKAVTEIKSKDSEKTLKYKGTYQISITVNPSNANNKEVTYKSSNTDIATVDSKGKVTAKSKTGTSTITITSKDNTKVSTKVKINVTTSSGVSVEKAKSYSSPHSLGTLSLTKELTVESSKTYRFAQGFCVAGNYYIAASINHSDSGPSKSYIRVYEKKKNGKLILEEKRSFDHANGMTYNPSTKAIYIARSGDSDRKDSKYGNEHRIYYKIPLSSISKKKLEVTKGGFYNKESGSYLSFGGVAYDPTTKLYYLGNGSNVHVYNSSTKKKVKTIKKVITGTTQDVGAYNGMVLVMRWNSDAKGSNKTAKGARNAIDIYRISDEAYLGTYIVPTNDKHEIESIDYDESTKKFVLYFNIEGTGNNPIYTTKIPFNFK